MTYLAYYLFNYIIIKSFSLLKFIDFKYTNYNFLHPYKILNSITIDIKININITDKTYNQLKLLDKNLSLIKQKGYHLKR